MSSLSSLMCLVRMGYVSEDEYEFEETLSRRSNTSLKGDEAFAKKKSGLKKSELDEQLKEYISEWRKNREDEEDELKRMKEKQLRRKEIRAEQDRVLAQQKRDEEDTKRREENEKRAAEVDEKKKQLEAAEAKRQATIEAQKLNPKQKKTQSSQHEGNSIRRELSKTKEQLEEEKKIALSIRVKPIEFDVLDSDELKYKAAELFDIIVKLETDKYDYEQRSCTQDYELRELRERQKVQLRQRAVKKGLDPEAFTGKHPPKIRMYSKYERRTDTRTYEDRQKLYEGGWDLIKAEHMETSWRENYEEWSKRTKAKLPKWFGERPGKREGEPDSPEGEDEDARRDEEEDFEEEEEYEEEEEEEYSEEDYEEE